MKNVPNILTCSRIILALILFLFFHEMSAGFIVIFSIAMLTDLVDGQLARKLGACSKTGAMLDSIADFALDLNLIKLVFAANIMSKKMTFWLISALCIGLVSPIINFIKHKKIFFIHSIPCKICMWILFGVPFSIYLGFGKEYVIFTLAAVTYAMVELVIVSIILNTPNPNAKSIYEVIKQNKAIKIKV